MREQELNKRICRTRQRIRIVSAGILAVLLLGQALYRPVYAGEDARKQKSNAAQQEAGSSTSELPDDKKETEEQLPVRIVLRPVKTEGEADPDLTGEIKKQVQAAIDAGTKDKDIPEKNAEPAPAVGGEKAEQVETSERLQSKEAEISWQETKETQTPEPETEAPGSEETDTPDAEAKVTETEKTETPETETEEADTTGTGSEGTKTTDTEGLETEGTEETETEPAEEEISLQEWICSLISWSYTYDDQVEAPGYSRPAGTSPILLQFKEDLRIRFNPDDGEDSQSFLTTLPLENGGNDEENQPQDGEEPSGGNNSGSDGKEDGGHENPDKTGGHESGEQNDKNTEDSNKSGDNNADNDENNDNNGDKTQNKQETGHGSGTFYDLSGGESQSGPGSMSGEDPSGEGGEEGGAPETSGEMGPGLDEQRLLEETIIDGVEDGHSYTGDVQPQVTLSEGGYASADVTLRRSRMGEVEDVTGSLVLTGESSGQKAQAEALTAVPENDGLYTLEVTYRDDSGNEVKKEVSFTVNRFGSVYAYNDALQNIKDAWVRSVTEPLIISEYNPDPLLEDSLEIEITRDGVPLKNVRYSAEQAERSSEGRTGGWYRYDYTIDPANFRKDGTYRISVSSKDAAGNRPDSISSESGEILFRVDSAAPTIRSISGLEMPFVRAESQKVRFIVRDNMGLASVTVWLDDAILLQVTSFEDPGSYHGEFTIDEGTEHHVRIIACDLAGNILDTDRRDRDGRYLFAPISPFVREITVSDNLLAFLIQTGQGRLIFAAAGIIMSLAALLIFLGIRAWRTGRYREEPTRWLR